MCIYEQIHTYLYTNKCVLKNIYIYTRYVLYINNMQLPFGVPIGLYFFSGFFNKNHHLLRGFMFSI